MSTIDWGTRRKRTARRRPFHIPEEIIFAILIHLPVISLLRFRSVCKLWRTIISSSKFIETHRALAASKPHANYIIAQKYDTVSFIRNGRLHVTTARDFIRYGNGDDQRFCVSDSNIRVVESCNGLVCIKTRELNSCEYIWNPATRQCKQLPPHLFWIRGFTVSSIIGFGYDGVRDDYMVVRVASVNNILPTFTAIRAEVYSLSLDSWREVRNGLQMMTVEGLASFHCNGTVGGVPYWIGNEDLMKFDVNTNAFRRIALPEDHEHVEGYVDKGILEFRGSVSVAMFNNGEYRINFWSLDNGWGGGWTMKLSIDRIPGMFWLAGAFLNDRLVVENQLGRMFVYDLESKRSKFVPNFDCFGCTSKVCNYMESLTPIRGSTAVEPGAYSEDD